ncbi:uncharacterized protein LOC134844776 [Symsagittifera roscoffensis]|uniref:uncharacterized protein LOC134844776 n=1 Tax=Symsagittifera roscoffensis TaxID=84072 RepID=UPI00307B33E8
MTRAQQTGEAYPDLSIMKRELERTQRERNKAKLERDQAVVEKDQARRELDMLRAEHLQAERVRENAANCEQLKSELERIQQRQRELDMQKRARPKERVVMRLLEVWIPTESASSLRGLETQELRIQMDPAILTECTIPYNMKADQHAMEMNTKVRNLNEIIRQIHQRSVLPVGLLDVAEQMELSAFPDNASSDRIHFDRSRGVEWLNDVFQRHISALEAELLETAQVTFGPPPNPPFFNPRALSSRLGAMADSRDSSRNCRTKLPGAAPMEAEEATSSTPQGSIISSVVVAEKKKPERSAETSRSRYVEKVKELDLEDLECRLELAEALSLERVSHEDLGRHHMELTITSSTSKSRGPSNERKNVAAAEKQLESMVYRLTQERGRWPFLTPRLENATEQTREDAPPLVKQIWDFLEEQLEVVEKREMTVARIVTAANEVTIGGFWREHAKDAASAVPTDAKPAPDW